MSVSKLQKAGVAAAIGLVAAFGATTSAMALEAGQCASAAEVNQALKMEDQHSLITANRVTTDTQTRPAQIVTGNSQGDGYLLEGNQPVGIPSTSFCVGLKLTNMKLFDARKPGITANVLVAGEYDKALRNADKKGTRPMLQAQSVFNGKLGSVVMISANTNTETGGMDFVKTPEGSYKIMAVYQNIKYTNTALATLDKPIRSASLDY